MKLITTKREYTASTKFITGLLEQLRPMMVENKVDQKVIAKVDQYIASPKAWDDIVTMVKEPIIIDADGSAIYIDGNTIVIDVAEVVTLKGIAVTREMSSFVLAVAKPVMAVVVMLGSLKDIIKSAAQHYKQVVKGIDNYSVMTTQQLIVALRQRECGISELNMTDAEMADILRSLDRVEAARVATAEASVKKAAAELAAFEHDAAKPDTVEEL